MIDKNKILEIAQSTDIGKEFVVVEVDQKPTNDFTVFVESLEGISIGDCVKISRNIEQHFDREVEDYELSVSSAGIDKPLKAPIQYIKNIGREAEIVLTDNKKFIGKLLAFNNTSITVGYSEKIKVEGSKKTQVVDKELEIELIKIKTVTIVVSFK